MKTNEKIINEPYGFIYITTNMVNGRKYLGQKGFDKDWKNYLGSGTAFKKAIEKYGKENFSRNIVLFCFSEEELNQAEYDLSVFLNVVEDENWYNLCYGGGGVRGSHRSNETRELLRRLNLGKNNPNYGLRRSEETKKKQSEAMIGKPKIYANENGNPLKILICQYNLQGELIEKFLGSYEACQQTGISRSAISNCLCGISKTAGGYIWRNDNEPLTEEDVVLANSRKSKSNQNANGTINEYGKYQKWYDKQKQKWRVRFVSNNETNYLGIFLTEKDAENAINQHNKILMKGDKI
jgi:group I intron endonuclease